MILVGNPHITHVGAHLSAGARDLGHRVVQFNTDEAFAGNDLLKKISWRFGRHRPNRLRSFSTRVLHACREQEPRWILSTGIAPLDRAALVEIGKVGTRRLNYLTDDPWNPSHRAPWFMDALLHYDWIFSPRRSNLADLRAHGCLRVSYLPFAYAPHLHYSESPRGIETARFSADVVFAGGADPDRVPLIAMLIRKGFTLSLYGGYWERYSETKLFARGHADPETLRKAVRGAKVALCLVRRANRDGNSMRTFEIAAMGACVLAEYTDEHREILGADGEAVVYFRSTEEMLDRLLWLLRHDHERLRLATALRVRIETGRNTYTDRLMAMLQLPEGHARQLQ